MNPRELFVGQPVMVPGHRRRDEWVESWITKIGRLYVHVNDGWRYEIATGERHEGFGRMFTLDGWVDHLDREANLKALRLYGVEVDSRRLVAEWSNAQIKALASAVATIRETVNERDR